MQIGILQPGYLPWLGFFEQMSRVDTFVLYDDVQYDKQGWRNRNKIKSAHGSQWLTVPVLTKGRRTQLINQAKVNSTAKWSTKHLKSLETNYRKADFFDSSFPEIQFLEKKWNYLLDLNLSLIFFLTDYLGIKSKIILSSSLNKKLPKDSSPESRLIEICRLVGGNSLYEGSAGQNYIDSKTFEEAEVGLTYQDYKHPVYKQLYGSFTPYLLVLDALTYAGSVSNLPEGSFDNNRFEFWYGDVRNAELVDTLVSQSDIVVHFAAETHVTRSIYDNLLFFETDVIGTQIVANAIEKYRKRIERFVHVSTSEVYGTARSEMMDEEEPLFPMSPYASAKVGADRLVYSYWATYETPAIIVRPFNNFGPRQHLEKAIPRFITSCMLEENLMVHGDGSAQRDYLFIQDTCDAIDLLMHTDIEKVQGEVFNIASGVHRSIHSVAQDIVETMKPEKSKVVFVGERPGQVFRHTGCYSKLTKTTGWEPKVTWEEGLNKTIEWYHTNRDWWKQQLWMRAVPIITRNGKREMH